MKSLNINTQSKKAKQGENKKHIGQYLRQWLGCSLLCVSTAASAAPGDIDTQDLGICGILSRDTSTNLDYLRTDVGISESGSVVMQNESATARSGSFTNTNIGIPDFEYGFLTFSILPPLLGQPTPLTITDVDNEPPATGLPQTIYASLGASTTSAVCTYSYILTNAGPGFTRSNFQVYERLAPSLGITDCAANDIGCIGEAINFNKTPFCDSIIRSQTPGHYVMSTLFGKTVDTADGSQPNDLDMLIEERCFPDPD